MDRYFCLRSASSLIPLNALYFLGFVIVINLLAGSTRALCIARLIVVVAEYQMLTSNECYFSHLKIVK